MSYLPRHANIKQTCEWLTEKTGETWLLPRLMEHHLTPHFWLDYKPDQPAIFGNRVEGFLTRMPFNGDLNRLEADGTDALVTMFTAFDGKLVKVEPGWHVPLAELRFLREDVERIAREATIPTTPAPEDKSSEIDFSKWVTRERLINAFGSFTGMDKSWFDNLKDTPKLKAARKHQGQGGRGHIVEPLFCPYMVMKWLIDPNRRKGDRKLQSDTGWRMLKAHFPEVYEEHQHEIDYTV